jgi:methyl-accepting chemotaxis protein
MNQFSVRRRFHILLAVFVLGFAFFFALSYKVFKEVGVHGPMYESIVQKKDLIADILPPPSFVLESYLVATQIYQSDDRNPQGNAALLERLKGLKAEYQTRYSYWTAQNLPLLLKDKFLVQAHEPITAFYTLIEKDLIDAKLAQDEAAAKVAFRKITDAFLKHRQAIDQVVEIATKLAIDTEAQTRETLQWSTFVLVGVFVITLLLCLSLALVTSTSIVAPLTNTVQIAKKFAAGDLTVHLKQEGTHEIGELNQALRDMQQNLMTLVRKIQIGSQQVANASAEIASGNHDLSARTESQASSLEQTASSMDQLGSTVRQNADNARTANQLAQSASTVAVRGGEVVAQVVDTMKGINDSSRKISDIISVIDGIAFQTNILALNAAVEAARAGEQGRGFAVVAGEVRSLAQRSAEAAKEIKTLISASVERVEHGSQLVDEAGNTMQEVVASIRHVTDIMGEISAASTEQSLGVAQVGEAVTQMDQVTQQNAALVEEMAAAASSLKNQAEELLESAYVLKIDGNNSSQASDHTALRRNIRDITPKPMAVTSSNTNTAKLSAPSPLKRPSSAATAPKAATGTQAAASQASASDEWESF